MLYRVPPWLVIRSPWRPYRRRSSDRVLTLRANAAFPPAHPSTRLALHLLQELTATHKVRRVLDLGCGSGVLMLAAAALGAHRGLGVDLSRRSLATARANARSNGFAPLAASLVCGSSDCLKGRFDLILANLPLAVQLEKVGDLTRLSAPRGWLILAGFKDVQEAELWRQYEPAGWRQHHRLSREEWVIELPPEKSYTWVAWLLQRPSDPLQAPKENKRDP